MFERLKKLYKERRLGYEGIKNAVIKGWITEEEASEIINSDNE